MGHGGPARPGDVVGLGPAVSRDGGCPRHPDEPLTLTGLWALRSPGRYSEARQVEHEAWRVMRCARCDTEARGSWMPDAVPGRPSRATGERP
jgi:hypothetical protein